jgi:hypothetical protein
MREGTGNRAHAQGEDARPRYPWSPTLMPDGPISLRPRQLDCFDSVGPVPSRAGRLRCVLSVRPVRVGWPSSLVDGRDTGHYTVSCVC